MSSISLAAMKELMRKPIAERDEILVLAAEAAASDYEDADMNLSDLSEPYHEDSKAR